MISRGQNFKQEKLNIVGSSTFGRYPKISIEKTYNMFMSDNWMVPYAGYSLGIPANMLGNGITGRGIRASTKLGKLICVFSANVYLIEIDFNQANGIVTNYQAVKIGELQTTKGVVYISENNKPQIAISDGVSIYIYDPNPPMGVSNFSIATKDGTNPIDFIPGQIDFHDTYFLCAAKADGFYSPSANNTWRLSAQSNGLQWPDDEANIGLLQTKPDNTQAVVRFPSKGNMIFVFGSTVIEPWFDVAYQLFPYQRNTSFNIDYGCLNPATIASMDEMVVWLGINEKAGPVVFYSDGGMPEQITTDGFDYVLANLQNPEDSQAFIYRQDGHLFYHINFYSDNLSFFVDFLKDGTKKIYHACDEKGNYFIASQVAFFNNQYYFVSKNNGNLYAFDTIFTTYDGAEIPRIRTCKSIRNIQQEPVIINDCGFTIETGETNYLQQTLSNSSIATDTPRVDLSISIDGGEHFSSYDPQILPAIGQRINKLAWWQLGWSNDWVPQFRFWGFSRFVATDGYVNIRQ
jgi:hypothetical protein